MMIMNILEMILFDDYSDDSTDIESNIDLSDININNEVDGEIKPVDSLDDRIIRIDDLNDIKPGYYVFIDLEYETKLTDEGKKWAEMASEYMKNSQLKDMIEHHIVDEEPDEQPVASSPVEEPIEPVEPPVEQPPVESDIVVDEFNEKIEQMDTIKMHR